MSEHVKHLQIKPITWAPHSWMAACISIHVIMWLKLKQFYLTNYIVK